MGTPLILSYQVLNLSSILCVSLLTGFQRVCNVADLSLLLALKTILTLVWAVTLVWALDTACGSTNTLTIQFNNATIPETGAQSIVCGVTTNAAIAADWNTSK